MSKTMLHVRLAMFVWASAFASAFACDLEPWLNSVSGADTGYHVLCVQNDTGVADVYVDGIVGGRTVKLSIDDSFVQRFEAELGIKDEVVFLPHQGPSGRGSWNKGRVIWPKPSWALFHAASGKRVRPGSEAEALKRISGTVLLFEGGVWRWPSIRRGYERPVLPGVILRTVSMMPGLFELVFQGEQDPKGLSRALLDGVIARAEPRLQRSMTEGYMSDSRTSEAEFLDYESTPKLQLLRKLIVRMLRIPKDYFESRLQVLRYQVGQKYDAHRDYWDPREFPDPNRFLHRQSKTFYNRHATVLWFLQAPESGGDTWFPRAHGGPIPYDNWTACDHRGENLGGRKGTIAILFYSLHSNGDIDEFSWHCGCPVEKGTKWAANSWIWNQPAFGLSARHPGKRPIVMEYGDASEATETPDREGHSLQVTNTCSDQVQVYWVGSDGEQLIQTVAAGATQSVNTFPGHTFRAKSACAGTQEYTVKPLPKRQQVTIARAEL